MTNPNIPPSDEVRHEAVTDFILAEDWDARLTADCAGIRALNAELDEATDRSEVLALTEMKNKALIHTLGSATISLFKRDVVTERAQFEAEFGEGK